MKTICRNYNIDVLRTILALLVIFIHFPVAYDAWVSPLYRCTIPTFFLISGYFLFGKTPQQKDVKKSIKRVFVMTFVWGVLYLIYDNFFIGHIRNFIIYTPRELIELLLFNRVAHGFHLWYLSAYLYALVFILIFLRLNLFKWRYLITGFLLLINLLLSNYSELFLGKDFPFYYTRNGLLFAFPLVLLGGCVKNDINIENLKKYSSVFLFIFIAIYIGYIVEVALWGESYFIATGTLASVVSSVVLFLFVLSLGNGNETIWSKIGRKYSLYIYLLHPLLLPLLPFVNCEYPICGALLPFMVFVISLIFAKLLVSLKNLVYEKIAC